MVAPIGPWIAPTLVLIGILIFHTVAQNKIRNLVYSVVAGSPGGIISTALGFTFPTLYFLDKDLFVSWLSKPIFFCSFITCLVLICGLIAFYFVNRVEKSLIEEQKLAFPIGELTYKMISANSTNQSWQLFYGVILTTIFCALQDIKLIIPKTINIFQKLCVSFDLFPLSWAIGFVTGHVIAIPLLVGALSKFFIADVINNVFFSNLSNMEFGLAFSSGLVLFSAVVGSLKLLPKKSLKDNTRIFQLFPLIRSLSKNLSATYLFIPILFLASAFLFYFKFSFVSQIYLIVCSLICMYQVVVIAGKIGLAQLGRFATLVMLPGMLIFNLDYVQIVILAVFIELSAGIATDLLFGRKIGFLAQVDSNKLKLFQLLGIVVSAITAGIVFLFFAKNLQLGSGALFAQRAQARALLVCMHNFNYFVLLIGFVFGYILQKLKMNPLLVLGGLLMPVNITISLLTGALFRYVTPKKYDFEPFWSGVFATQSIWILFANF